MASVTAAMVLGVAWGANKIAPATWKRGEMQQRNMRPSGAEWNFTQTEIEN